jgi:hypothetical protein
MSTDHEYQRQADECRRMSDNAISADDKRDWLKMAASWLQMLPRYTAAQNWPIPSGQDSKKSR